MLALHPHSSLIRPLGLCTQAFKLGDLISFVILSILIIIVNSCNVCVFYSWIFRYKLDLFIATCSNIIHRVKTWLALYIYGQIFKVIFEVIIPTIIYIKISCKEQSFITMAPGDKMSHHL
jgi:hypothetical protein